MCLQPIDPLAKKIRIWPSRFRDRIWPNRIWPILVFCCFGQISGVVVVVVACWCLLCVLCVCCVCSRFLGLSPGPPFPWTAQNFAFFSLSHRKFHSFFRLWGVFSWNCGRCSRPWPTQNAGFGWCHFVKPRPPDHPSGPSTPSGPHSSGPSTPSGPHPFGPHSSNTPQRTPHPTKNRNAAK